MDSLISATAARVVFIEGNEFSLIEADNPRTRTPVAATSVPYLFADAHDVVFLKNTTVSDSFNQLLRDWNSDRALRMLDILLDPESPFDETKDAAHYFLTLLKDRTTEVHVRNRAFAVPLRDHLTNFVDIADTLAKSDVATAFVQELFETQDRIEEVRSAWERIPDALFESARDRSAFELAAINSGSFRKIVEALGDNVAMKNAVFDCYLNLQSQKNARSIVSDWTKDFVDRPIRRKLARLESEQEELDDEGDFEKQEGSVHEVYTYTRKRQSGIISQLHRGNFELARRYTNQLVDWQLKNGGPEYASLSLCLLAQEAKHIGQGSLQLEWVQRALDLAPDARAHGQAGDAFLSLYRLDEAEREYSLSIQMGNVLFGRTGLARVLRVRGLLDDALKACIEIEATFANNPEIIWTLSLKCEILRDMWRLEEALSAYRGYADRFPENSGFLCGVASVLKDSGNLLEALEVFSVAARRFPNEPVARGGKADSLKLLGRIDDAIAEYDSAIEAFPWEAMLVGGKADVLRTAGRYEDAAAIYRTAIIRFPHDPVIYCGYADTKRDQGEIDEALRAYEDAIRRFKSDPRCRTGHANVLRKAGRYDEALQAMDRNVRDFPYDLYSLMGRANLLKLLGSRFDALDAYQKIIDWRHNYAPAKYGKAAVHISFGQYEEASSLLPKGSPITLSDWIGFHIRGMMHLKKGDLSAAILVFEEGIARNPFHQQRLFFETSLAAAKIRRNQFSEAADLLRATEDAVGKTLRIHGLAASGRSNEASALYFAANDNAPPPVVHLRDAIAARFGFEKKTDTPDEQWIFDQETEVLLQAA